MSIDSSRRFKFLKVNNNSNQAKRHVSSARDGLWRGLNLLISIG